MGLPIEPGGYGCPPDHRESRGVTQEDDLAVWAKEALRDGRGALDSVTVGPGSWTGAGVSHAPVYWLHLPLLSSGISSTNGSQVALAQPNLRTVSPLVQVAVAAALIS